MLSIWNWWRAVLRLAVGASVRLLLGIVIDAKDQDPRSQLRRRVCFLLPLQFSSSTWKSVRGTITYALVLGVGHVDIRHAF